MHGRRGYCDTVRFPDEHQSDIMLRIGPTLEGRTNVDEATSQHVRAAQPGPTTLVQDLHTADRVRTNPNRSEQKAEQAEHRRSLKPAETTRKKLKKAEWIQATISSKSLGIRAQEPSENRIRRNLKILRIACKHSRSLFPPPCEFADERRRHLPLPHDRGRSRLCGRRRRPRPGAHPCLADRGRH